MTWQVPVDKRATINTPKASTYAKAAVARIGYDVMVSPHWTHEIFMWILAMLPEMPVGAAILNMHKGIRFHKK